MSPVLGFLVLGVSALLGLAVTPSDASDFDDVSAAQKTSALRDASRHVSVCEQLLSYDRINLLANAPDEPNKRNNSIANLTNNKTSAGKVDNAKAPASTVKTATVKVVNSNTKLEAVKTAGGAKAESVKSGNSGVAKTAIAKPAANVAKVEITKPSVNVVKVDTAKPGANGAKTETTKPNANAKVETAKPGTGAAKVEPAKAGAVNVEAAKAGTGTKKEHKHVSEAPKAMLVPPPPPSVPTMSEINGIGGPTIIFAGENVDYMPAADLKELRIKTERDVQRAKSRLEELTSTTNEKQQKATNFDQLFAEGVISRRELEASKHEGEQATLDLADAKQNLSLLEQKQKRIEARLELLSKQKSAKTSSRSTRHSAKH